METLIAVLATIILAGLAIFQIMLIMGKPLGKYAWGGQYEILPTRLRVASGFSILFYIVFALIILSASNAAPVFQGRLLNTATWTLSVYFFIGVAMNRISRSKPERMVMTPIALALALLCLLIAL